MATVGPLNGTHPVLLDNDFVYVDVLVYGYITPPLVLFTAVTNVLICVVLLKRNMRSPTNCMLVAMALSDMFTSLLPLVPFIHFYTFGHYIEWTPHSWCLAYDWLTDFLPTVFHTASIWLTVALAVQRYICVCRPTVAVRHSTVTNVVKVACVIYAAAFVSQICRFAESTYEASEQPSRVMSNGTMVIGCERVLTSFVEKNTTTYYSVYYWFRVVFIHLIPCQSLVVLNALLINAIRGSQARRRKLLRQNRRSECRRLKDSNCTTLMLVLVVGVFLVVEFPLAILIIIFIYENALDTIIMSKYTMTMSSILINLFIMFSYPVNFFIYCAMSRQFRETFTRLFRPRGAPLEPQQSQYLINATENGADKPEHTCDTRM